MDEACSVHERDEKCVENVGWRWEDTIKMDLKETVCEDVGWILLS
jgi:hypothetical protein